MIKYSIKEESNTIKEMVVKGHANFDQSGKDIVCAAVSSAIIITVNALKHLKIDNNVNFEVKEGYFKLNVLSNEKIVIGLLENLKYALTDLEKQYPKYLKNQKEG